MSATNHVTVYEHDCLRIGEEIGCISREQLAVLQAFYGEYGSPYYTLINGGVKFCEYVGIIQVGNLTIEVLPKMDRETSTGQEAETWRSVLLGMLAATGFMNVHASNSSNLNIKKCSFLDYYLDLFLNEVESLVHRGLIKKYRKQEGNVNTMKGGMVFSKNLQQNIIHKERFYVKRTVYDQDHLIHQIIYKTLLLVEQINRHPLLKSRIGALLLSFPQQKSISVDNRLFSRLCYDRKSEAYQHCVEICRLLLLNYHPDVLRGKESVLAIMFDMNMLWENFVFKSVKKAAALKDLSYSVMNKSSRQFWQQADSNITVIKPDIVIEYGEDRERKIVVLDTKWKNLNDRNPSVHDLRQLYVYHQYYHAEKVALVYPGEFSAVTGKFFNADGTDGGQQECSVLSISIEKNVRQWQANIFEVMENWMTGNKSASSKETEVLTG